MTSVRIHVLQINFVPDKRYKSILDVFVDYMNLFCGNLVSRHATMKVDFRT